MPKPSDTLNDTESEVPVHHRRRHDGHAAPQPAPSSAEEDALTGTADAADARAARADRPGAAESPEADLAATTRERDDYYDRLLRKTAEFDNYRKRVERERREQADYAAAEVLADLLPLVDDLERALQAGPETGADSYRRGVELIHRQMLDLLRRRGVTPIEAVGKPFDPHLEEAVTHEAVPGHADGEVVEEFRRGYKLRDRLLRPAMVKVAKA